MAKQAEMPRLSMCSKRKSIWTTAVMKERKSSVAMKDGTIEELSSPFQHGIAVSFQNGTRQLC